MAKAREIRGLSCEQPYGHSAALIVEARTAELADHAAGVLDTEDIERLHDMRVATRRLRAALEVFEPCFPRKSFRAALRDVKALADALGERRDRDIAIASLRSFGGTIGVPDRPGVESLIARLAIEQREANEALGDHLSGDRLGLLLADLRRLVSEAYAPGRIAAESWGPADAGARDAAELDAPPTTQPQAQPTGGGLEAGPPGRPSPGPWRPPNRGPARAVDDLAEHLRSTAAARKRAAQGPPPTDAEAE